MIRVPRPDVAALLGAAPPGLQERFDDAARGIAAQLEPAGWLAFAGAPAAVYARAAAADADAILTEWWNAVPARLDAILHGAARLYGPAGASRPHRPPATQPGLPAIRAGRLALLGEALDAHRCGRHASAIMLAISQLDGIAADVPPTPGAAFPFLVHDARDLAAPDPLLTADRLAAHPACSRLVGQLMGTGRPDTNAGAGLHRHGIMHGRDLAFGTCTNATKVLTVLLALIQWAEPVAHARAT